MSNKTKGKIIIASGVAFLASFAVFSAVYLPFYSDLSKQKPLVFNKQDKALGSGSKGSMWSNLDNEIKSSNKGTKE